MRKNIFNFIETLNPNDIKSFKASDDQLKVVMVMKDAEEVEFPIKTGFGSFYFYRLIENILGEEPTKSVFSDVNGYISVANCTLVNNDIRNILVDVGSDANPSDIRSIMLDGFKHTNLFTFSERENNLKKYVLIALELLNELNGDASVIYTNKFRQRVLKVGVI